MWTMAGEMLSVLLSELLVDFIKDLWVYCIGWCGGCQAGYLKGFCQLIKTVPIQRSIEFFSAIFLFRRVVGRFL